MGHRRAAADHRSRQGPRRGPTRCVRLLFERRRQGNTAPAPLAQCAIRERLEIREQVMGRFIAFLYGITAYILFFITILYAIGFVSDLAVPKTIDSGAIVAMTEALLINLLLMSVFAIQHSVMARKPFKQWWTQFVPKPVERSAYVLLSSLALVLLFWQWRPIPAVVWHIDNPQLAVAMTAISHIGWLIVLTSTF